MIYPSKVAARFWNAWRICLTYTYLHVIVNITSWKELYKRSFFYCSAVFRIILSRNTKFSNIELRALEIVFFEEKFVLYYFSWNDDWEMCLNLFYFLTWKVCNHCNQFRILVDSCMCTTYHTSKACWAIFSFIRSNEMKLEYHELH